MASPKRASREEKISLAMEQSFNKLASRAVPLIPGTAVEIVRPDAEDSPDVWYPATVIEETRDGSFVVKYRKPNQAGPLSVTVEGRHIRPAPPACVNPTFQLLQKVDAFCNNGWSSGIVTKLLSEGRYIVYFKRTRKEKELRHADLRLPMQQISGIWFNSSSQDAAIISKPGKNRELNRESAPKELQLSLEPCETQMTPIEQLNNVRPNTSMEESENGNQSCPNSANPERRLEISEESFDAPTNKETPLREIKRRGPGRPPRSVSRSPRASVSGVIAKQNSVTNSIQSYAQKQIVISLPCYNNSKWNTLQPQSNNKLPVHNAAEVQEVKKQIPNAATGWKNARNVSRGNPDVRGLNNGGITPKRKRGRPFGSFSAAKRKLNETDRVLTGLDSTQRRSTRERKEVYKSAIDTLKPKGKKMKSTTEIESSIQENEASLILAQNEANQNENADGVITDSIRENVEPDSHEVSGNVSDEDMPLSAWFGEAHSLPNPKKLNSGGNASQSWKSDLKTDQISSDKCSKETTSGSDVDLAQSASQHDNTTTQRDEEEMTKAIVNGLPFIKKSPLWEVIESMEVFKQIPQNPHFQPLYNAKEHCREGSAISSMVTFSHLVEDLPKFQFDDPIKTLEDSLETLSELEEQGFSVGLITNRLSDLLSIKRKHDPSSSLADEIAEEEKGIAEIDQELDDIEKRMAELSNQRASIVLEREKRDSNIGGLRLRFDSVREALDEARSEFQRLATAPW